MGSLSDSFDGAVAGAGYDVPKDTVPVKRKSLSGAFDAATAMVADKPAIEYVDDSKNPNAAPTEGQRIEISGVAKTPADIGNRIVGSGEAVLNAGTGMLSAVPGAVAGLSSILTNGKFGTQEGVQEAAKRFGEVSDAYTYQPRTAQGQKYSAEIGDTLNNSGVMGLAPMAQFHALAGASRPALAAEAGAGDASSQLGAMLKAKQGAMAIEDRIEPTYAKPRVKLNVDGTQTPIASQGVTPEMMAGPQGSAGVPGANSPAYAPPTLADTPAAFQKAAAGRVNDATLQRHVEAQSLPIPMNLTEGLASGDPAILSKEKNLSGENPAVMRRYNELNGQLVGNLNAIRDEAAPLVTARNTTEHGDTLVSSYSKLNDARTAEVSANYEKVADANGGDLPIDGKAFVANVNKDLKSDKLVSTKEFLPATVQKIVDKIGESDAQMTLDDYGNLRTILAGEVRKAQRSGDGNAVHAISVVRDNLENVPMTGDAATIKPLIDQAKASAAKLINDRKADPAWTAVSNGMEPGKLVQSTVINGSRDGLTAMRANLAGDELAQQTITAAGMDHLQKQAAIGLDGKGTFAQKSYNKQLDAWDAKKDVLLGDAANKAKTLGNVASYVGALPAGHVVSTAGTVPAMLQVLAAKGAEHGTNLLFHGVPVGSVLAKGADILKSRSATADALKPAAGTTKLSKFPSLFP